MRKRQLTREERAQRMHRFSYLLWLVFVFAVLVIVELRII